jgi:exonuclease SbcC
MKILSIRFRNLNSLAGEWEIDLQDPSFASCGIFAITGPTGSGKTTILDAVCLALYGQTPRLEKISAAANEIMTRRTGECFAEVIFESSRGIFRCNWRQKRAHGKPGGKLQQPEHEIVDAATNRVLENKIRDVSGKVREVTGMDFEQFTRSVLLAQGEFSAFLKARPDERAPILEQITGTGIYSSISRKVHERTAQEREILRRLQERAEAIQILGSEEEDSLKAQIETKEGYSAGLGEKIRTLKEKLDLISRVAELQADVRRLQEEQNNLAKKRSEVSGELARLEKAGKAAEFEPEWNILSGLQEKEKQEQKRIAELRSRKLFMQEECIKAESGFRDSENAWRGIQEEISGLRPIITRVRELDSKISILTSQSDMLGSDIESLENKRRECQSDYHSLCRQHENYTRSKDYAEKYLKEHEGDALLTSEYSGLHTRIETYIHHQESVITTTERLQKVSESLEQLRRELELKKGAQGTCQKELGGIQERITEIDSLISTILSGVSIREILEKDSVLKNECERLNRLEEAFIADRRNQDTRTSLVSQGKLLADSLAEQEKIRSGLLLIKNQQEERVSILEKNVVLAARVRDLEEERDRLISGNPCPLCGSRDHPYCSGDLPDADEEMSQFQAEKEHLNGTCEKITRTNILIVTITHDITRNEKDQETITSVLDESWKEWICGAESFGIRIDAPDRQQEIISVRNTLKQNLAQVSDQVSQYETLEREREVLKENLSLKKDQLNRLSREKQETEHACTIRQSEYNSLEAQKVSLSQAMKEELAWIKEILPGLQITDPGPEKLAQIDTELKSRMDQYLEFQNQYRELGHRVQIMSSSIDAAQKSLNELAENISGKTHDRNGKLAELGIVKQERIQLFGDRDPGLEEERMSILLRETENRLESARIVREEKQREQDTLTGTIQTLSANLEKLREEIGEKTTRFLARIRGDFGDIASFRNELISPEELSRMKTMAADLDHDENMVKTLLMDKLQACRIEEEKVQDGGTREEILTNLDELQADLETIQGEIAVARHRLEDNRTRKDEFSGLIEETEHRKKEMGTWDRLHNLIGSADGKKFRIFAQGLTFRMLISHANRHLKQMTDRYILLPDQEIPLDFAVADTWQAGEIRSVKNLSGGESFIISLALALGLSGMASKNVRVDSLFLDEGFGALDDDALDTALGVLSGLHQQGKLIGIISHVPAIRERISAQIRVEKRSSGKSVLSAPGCRKIQP